MSDLTTIDRAATELTEMRRSARAGRKAFQASPLSVFERTMRAAMGLYLKAIKDGMSREDAARGLEEEVRGAWMKPTSKFAPDCGSCDDTGWVEHACWDGHRCGRETCARNPERQHLYVEPCGCVKGDRMRAKVRSTEDAIAAAGRTTKRKAGNWKQVGS